MSTISRRALALLMLLTAAGSAVAELPLPAGARFRYGSQRFLYDGWITDVAYSPDGKTLITGAVRKSGPDAGKSQLIFWNAATGEKRYESVLDEGHLWNVVASPDGKTIATYFTGKRQFTLYDATSGKLLRHIGQRTLGSPAFSPDGKVLVGAAGTLVHLWDVATGDELACFDGHTKAVIWVAFSSTGKHVASVGNDHTLRVWDVATGEIVFQHEEEERRLNFVDFTADGKSVAATAVVRNESKDGDLIVWDVLTGAETLRVPVKPDVQGIMFAPDRKLVLCELNAAEVRDSTGKLLRRFELGGHGNMRSWMTSPDGRYLAVGASGCTPHQWDLTTGKLRDDQPGHRFPIRSVAVSTDGRRVMTQDTGGEVRLWDSANGRELKRVQAPTNSSRQFPSASNGIVPFFVRSVADGLVLVDIETGKERSRLISPPLTALTLHHSYSGVSADGALLALHTSGENGVEQITLWETATGKKRREFESVPKEIGAIALSSDGALLAGVSPGVLRIWDTATGRSLRSVEVEKELRPQSLQFSVDGQRLLAVGQGTAIGVWDTATGHRLLSAMLDREIYWAAISPDGRSIAVALRLGDGEQPFVMLLDAATGQERCRFYGHASSGISVDGEGIPTAPFAFTRDGRSLITTGEDATALVWALPYRTGVRPLPKVVSDAGLLWADLTAVEGERSYNAVADLTAVPDLTVPLVRERLTPIKPLDENARKQISRWIADLDSDEFDKREKAAESLEKLEELAAPALRKALANDPSAEVKRHLNRLLDRLFTVPPAPEVLRAIRAVEVLEGIGTPAARRVLEELAAGAPEAHRTREAREALARLKGRK